MVEEREQIPVPLSQRERSQGTYLRAEARPAKWASMYDTQQNAFRALVNMIGEAVYRLPTPQAGARGRDVTGWVRENRSSQIAFLFGPRGTGKTTVLTSLYKSTLDADSPDLLRTFPPDVWEGVDMLQRRVVWLEPLDMETTIETTNLLASILARIEQVCQDWAGSLARRRWDPSAMFHSGNHAHFPSVLLDFLHGRWRLFR